MLRMVLKGRIGAVGEVMMRNTSVNMKPKFPVTKTVQVCHGVA